MSSYNQPIFKQPCVHLDTFKLFKAPVGSTPNTACRSNYIMEDTTKQWQEYGRTAFNQMQCVEAISKTDPPQYWRFKCDKGKYTWKAYDNQYCSWDTSNNENLLDTIEFEFLPNMENGWSKCQQVRKDDPETWVQFKQTGWPDSNWAPDLTPIETGPPADQSVQPGTPPPAPTEAPSGPTSGPPSGPPSPPPQTQPGGPTMVGPDCGPDGCPPMNGPDCGPDGCPPMNGPNGPCGPAGCPPMNGPDGKWEGPPRRDDREDWEKVMDEIAEVAKDNELMGFDDWDEIAEDIQEGIQDAIDNYNDVMDSGEFEEGGRSSNSVGLTAAFAASALAVTAIHF